MGKHSADDMKQMLKSPPPPEEADAMEREIDVLRQRTEDLIAELERRVNGTVERAKDGVERVKAGIERARELGDVPAQVRAHPRTAAGIGAGTVALVGFGIWIFVSRRAEDRRMSNRVRRRAQAYRALLADPERALAAREPSMRRKIITALIITASTQLLKVMVTRAARTR
jgi:hypothetical protein